MDTLLTLPQNVKQLHFDPTGKFLSVTTAEHGQIFDVSQRNRLVCSASGKNIVPDRLGSFSSNFVKGNNLQIVTHRPSGETLVERRGCSWHVDNAIADKTGQRLVRTLSNDEVELCDMNGDYLWKASQTNISSPNYRGQRLDRINAAMWNKNLPLVVDQVNWVQYDAMLHININQPRKMTGTILELHEFGGNILGTVVKDRTVHNFVMDANLITPEVILDIDPITNIQPVHGNLLLGRIETPEINSGVGLWHLELKGDKPVQHLVHTFPCKQTSAYCYHPKHGVLIVNKSGQCHQFQIPNTKLVELDF